MSASSEWTEWHMTQSGWVRGTTKTETGMQVSTPPPDSIATYQFIDEHSGYGRGTQRVVGPSATSEISEELGRLIKLHGPCPQKL